MLKNHSTLNQSNKPKPKSKTQKLLKVTKDHNRHHQDYYRVLQIISQHRMQDQIRLIAINQNVVQAHQNCL